MKQIIYDLLGEGGKLSLMRVQCLLICVIACHLAEKSPDNQSIVLGMLGIAIAGKAGQKAIELNKSASKGATQ